MRKGITINILLLALTILLVATNLLLGSVEIPAGQVLRAIAGMEVEQESWAYIVMESRLPQALTAMLCGASLATAGLLLQTSFRNPLAGPSILGITNGASLGVALVMLLFGGVITIGGMDGEGGPEGAYIGGLLAVTTGAFLGAMAVIMLLLALSRMVGSNLMLLIIGIMVSYLTSSAVSLLNFFAAPDNVYDYVLWGMGSFSDVSLRQLPWFAAVSLSGMCLAVLLIKPLNALLLGDNYAQNLGINIRRTHQLLLLTTGILTAVSTAYCGPVAFIGLAVPHIARLLTGTASHAVLLPATILCGAGIALLCNVISILPGSTIIPINAVTPIFGAPVILYIIVRRTAVTSSAPYPS